MVNIVLRLKIIRLMSFQDYECTTCTALKDLKESLVRVNRKVLGVERILFFLLFRE